MSEIGKIGASLDCSPAFTCVSLNIPPLLAAASRSSDHAAVRLVLSGAVAEKREYETDYALPCVAFETHPLVTSPNLCSSPNSCESLRSVLIPPLASVESWRGNHRAAVAQGDRLAMNVVSATLRLPDTRDMWIRADGCFHRGLSWT